jgi:hypothetical protein
VAMMSLSILHSLTKGFNFGPSIGDHMNLQPLNCELLHGPFKVCGCCLFNFLGLHLLLNRFMFSHLYCN